MSLWFWWEGSTVQYAIFKLSSKVIHDSYLPSGLHCPTQQSASVFPESHVQLHHLHDHSFLCFVDRASLYNLVNKANLMHNFSLYIYLFSLHVLGD